MDLWRLDLRSSNGGRPNPQSFFVRFAGTFDTHCRYGMSKSSWRSAAWKPITRQYGAGCSVMVRNWSSGSGGTSNPPIVLARRRDLCLRQGPLVLSIQGHRFGRCDDRFLIVGQARRGLRQTAVSAGAERSVASTAACHQHGLGTHLHLGSSSD